MNNEQNQFPPETGEDYNLESNPSPKLLTKQQKISLFSLGAFTILIMVFGILQFRSNIYGPLDYDKKIANLEKNKAGQTVTETDKTKMDSDNDGLSDSDEANVYMTSPYIEDSDSDGFTDKEEILNGTDPNCPAGQNCSQAVVDNSNDSTVASPDDLLEQTTTDTGSISGVDLTDEEQQLLNDMMAGKADTSVLRQMLLDSGMEKSVLDGITDEELIKSYKETIGSNTSAE